MTFLGALERHVIRAVLGGVSMVVLVLLSLGALFLFMGQQDDIGIGSYSTVDALLFVLLNMPQQTWELLPISTLIGALTGLGNLARGSELLVMRTAGLSIWQVARPVAIAGVVLAVIGSLLGEAFGPPLQQLARQQKAFAKVANVSFSGSGDAWVRDGNLLVNVEKQTGEARFGGMMVYEIGSDGRLAAMGRAVSASAAEGGSWALEQYAETRFTDDRVTSQKIPRRVLKSNVTAEFLGIAATIPAQLPTAVLWRMVRHLDANGLDGREAAFALWSRIARTPAPIFAALLALPFMFGSLRSSGAGVRVGLGLVLGMVFFFVQKMLESSTMVFNGNPALFAWLPPVLMAVAALTLLWRTR